MGFPNKIIKRIKNLYKGAVCKIMMNDEDV